VEERTAIDWAPVSSDGVSGGRTKSGRET